MKHLKRLTFLIAMLLPFTATAGPLLDINEADEFEISDDLVGVTLGQGRAIVEHRQENGRFESEKDLLEVEGINWDFLNLNQDYIRTGKSPQQPRWES